MFDKIKKAFKETCSDVKSFFADVDKHMVCFIVVYLLSFVVCGSWVAFSMIVADWLNSGVVAAVMILLTLPVTLLFFTFGMNVLYQHDE